MSTTKPTPKPYDPIAQLLALPHPPPTLYPGIAGKDAWAVRLMCRLLAAHGFGPSAWLDPAEAVPAAFDGSRAPGLVSTAQLVKDFNEARQLRDNTTCSAETWAWLGCRDPRSLGEVALVYARADAYACAREIGGDNRGEWVKRYLGWEGKDAQWCAGAATTWVNKARQRLGLSAWDWGDNRASSSALVKHAHKHGRLVHPAPVQTASERKCNVVVRQGQPRPGDLCIVKDKASKIKSGYRHTTLFVRTEGNRVLVMEGNVGGALSWLTDAVWRALGRPAGIVRPGSYPLSQVVFVRTS